MSDGDKKVTTAPTKAEPNNVFLQIIPRVKVVIRIEITDEITGYTIQALKGLDYIFSDPVVIVPTYKAIVYEIIDIDIGDQHTSTKNEKLTFNVTRDAWYNLGKNQNGAHEILNREFVPDNYQKNLYGMIWIPRYPAKEIYTSAAEAFILTRFGKKELPAKPLRRETHLDGTPIDEQRADPKIATDVLIHIGGTYEVYFRLLPSSTRGRLTGYQHVGGSYGCFGFIPESQIRVSPAAAKEAVSLDEYDNKTSNQDWAKVCNEIKNLAFPKKLHIQVLIHEKKTAQYNPTEILKE